MANFTESLTVRILGDSSQLQRELETVVGRIADLRTQLERVEEAGRTFGQTADRFVSWTRGLQSISRLVGEVAGQLRALGRIPVTLNVSPALAALATLSRAIGQVAGQLRALSAPGPRGMVLFSPIRRFAQGGLVSGPAGIDKVPAMLTRGEFVVREAAVRQLGSAFLEALNRGAAPPSRGTLPAVRLQGEAEQTVNNFGGISINVARGTDVNALIRDLRLHGFRMRNRRG